MPKFPTCACYAPDMGINRWHRMACLANVQIPPQGEARRLLVGSCWHNLGFRFFEELADVLEPDVVVCLGDLSGLDPLGVDSVVVQTMWNIRHPTVFAPGNHDLALVRRVMQLKGAAVLESPGVVDINGLRIWGWADPNRTRWGRKDHYSTDLCRVRAPLPPTGEPYLVAVHSSAMLPPPIPNIPLVLCGHAHVPKVWRSGSTVYARTGTAGGGGLNWPGKVTPRQAMVVDVKLPEHTAAGIWVVESDGRTISVIDALAADSNA